MPAKSQALAASSSSSSSVLRRSMSPLAAAAQMSSGAVSCACREAGMAMEKPNRLAMILVNPLKDSLVCPTGLAKASAEIDAKKILKTD